MSDPVFVDGVQYMAIRNAAGEITAIRRFNESAKMWVTVNFSQASEQESQENLDYVIKILSEEYINRALNKKKPLD